jgi:hypothetical protein
VLLHDSHADGSGAPGERDWVRTLNDAITAACLKRGIDVTRVPGDLQDHPAFHQDYAAFIAPHYDANIYGGVGGCFWGRASASLTAAEDDRLGAIFWRRYRALLGVPPEHFERLNVNVTDYYGFRLTTANTPGFLVEHGVGAPGAPDHDWLRNNLGAIAETHAAALAEFGGLGMIPQFVGQSVSNVNLKVGEVAQITGTWNYGAKGNRFIVAKVIGYTAGIRLVTLFPPADPDADPTLVLDAVPAYFIVATRTGP